MRLNKGFTIIELLIVIVIIGILVAITAVSYTGITNGANTADAQTKARAISQYAIACQAKTGSCPRGTSAGSYNINSVRAVPSRRALGLLLCTQFALARRRAQDVNQDGHGQQPIQHKSDDGSQDAALWAGRLGQRHHQRHIEPSNDNQVHG